MSKKHLMILFGILFISIIHSSTVVYQYTKDESPDLSIPDNNSAGVYSYLNVPDNYIISDLNVYINITHTYQADLIVELYSPDSTNVRLHNRSGGSADDIQTWYDTQTSVDGPGSLSDFNNKSSSGTWALWVSDNAGIDIGTINDWTLEIYNFISSNSTIYVSTDTGNDNTGDGSETNPYQTITKAVTQLSTYETVYIYPGTYAETISVETSYITITGVDSATTIIDPPGDSTVTGIYGIYVSSQTNVTIQNLAITGCYVGIYFNGVAMSLIENVNCTGCGTAWPGAGIYLSNNSQNNTIRNCYSANNFEGYNLYNSDTNNITNNISMNNSSAGFNISSSCGNTFSNNESNYNSQQGFWIYQSHTNTFDSNISTYNTTGGFNINTTNNNVLYGNISSNNLASGIYIYSSNNNVITNNLISNNTTTSGHGIYCYGSSNGNYVSQNSVDSNQMYGFYIENTCSYDTFNKNNWSASLTNPDSAIFNDCDTPIDLKYNYWSTTDSEAISQKVAGSYTNQVLWYPFRSSEIDTTQNADTIAPASPDTISAQSGNSVCTITWTDVTTNEESGNYSFSLTGYKIYRLSSNESISGDTDNWQVYYISVTTDTEYVDNNVSNGITYYYRVTAYDSYQVGSLIYYNESWYSDICSVVPDTSNTQPSLTIDSVIGSSDTITINYTSTDTEGDTLITSGWQYSLDGVTWNNISESSISGNEAKLPGASSIYWNSNNELDGIYDTEIYFRMKCIESDTLLQKSISSVLWYNTQEENGGFSGGSSSIDPTSDLTNYYSVTTEDASTLSTPPNEYDAIIITDHGINFDITQYQKDIIVTVDSSISSLMYWLTGNNKRDTYWNYSAGNTLHWLYPSWLDESCKNGNSQLKNTDIENASEFSLLRRDDIIASYSSSTDNYNVILYELTKNSKTWYWLHCGPFSSTNKTRLSQIIKYVFDNIGVSLSSNYDTSSSFTINNNDTPLAVIQSDTFVESLDTVTLDGSGSYDPDTTTSTLTYQWTQISGETVTITNSTDSIAYFKPSEQDTYLFQLIVSDSFFSSDPDTVIIGINIPGISYGGSIMYVSADTGNNSTGDGSETNPYQTITKAMTMISSHETVYVYSGTYAETIVIDTDYVSLVGVDSSNTIIDPPGDSTVTTLYGIYADTQIGLTIVNIRIYDCYNGILFNNVDNSNLDNIMFYDCGTSGAPYTGGAILLNYGSENNIIQNCFGNNGYSGFVLWQSSSNNTIINNTASNYFGGIICSQLSDNNNVIQNTVFNNNYGIYLYNSDNNYITRNVSSNNSIFGIYFGDSHKSYLLQNTVDSNANYQIYITGTSSYDTFNFNNVITSPANPDSAVYNGCDTAFDFKYNYWATTDSSEISQKIAGSYANQILWYPFRSSEIDTTQNADTIAPAAPDTISDQSGNSVCTITWNDVTTNEESGNYTFNLTGYKIYRLSSNESVSGDTDDWQVYYISVTTDTKYVDNNVSNGITYYYRITSYDSHLTENEEYVNESWYSDIHAAYPDIAQPNTKPSLTVDSISGSSDTIIINYTTADTENDVLTTIGWQYSLDYISWTDIDTNSITGDDTSLPGTGIIYWNTRQELNNICDTEVYIRMKCIEYNTTDLLQSEYALSDSFSIDNSGTPVVNINTITISNSLDTITLDGSSSYDPENDNLTFQWTQISGESVTIIDNSESIAYFYPGQDDVYIFKLSIIDSSSITTSETVQIIVDVNDTPVVLISGDTFYTALDTVTLNASSSYDSDSDYLSYQWSQLSGTSVTIINSTDSIAYFKPIDEDTYVFQFIISDSYYSSLPETIQIIVILSDTPIASIQAETFITNYDTIALDGSASMDYDNDPLLYQWSQLQGETGTLVNSSDSIAYFKPSEQDTYIFQLIVSDSYYSSLPDTIQIVIDINDTPVMYITNITGSSDTITIQYVTSDSENDTFITIDWQYSLDSVVWTDISETSITNNNPTSPGVNYIYWNSRQELNSVYDTEVYFRMKCQETDTNGFVSEYAVSDSFIIDNSGTPVAVIQSVNMCETLDTVTLNGSSSFDPENDFLYFQWTQLSGETVTITNSSDSIAYFKPSGQDTYLFQLIVSDSFFSSKPDTVQIIVDTNDTPVITITSIIGNSDTIIINYTDSDSEGDTLITAGWQYSLDGIIWNNISETSISGNEAKLPGASNIYWNSNNELDGIYDTEIYLRMYVSESEHGESISIYTNKTNDIGNVGASSNDYFSQSFYAEFNKINRIGSWIKESSSEGEVKIGICSDDGSGYPDENNFLFLSDLIDPNTTGQWYYKECDINVDSGTKYHLVIDGYNNSGASGYSEIGYTTTYTNTNQDMNWSSNGGSSWSNWSSPLAIYIYSQGYGLSGNYDISNSFVINNNDTPVAVIEAETSVTTFDTIILNCSGSYDPDTTSTLSYLWSQISGETVTIANSSDSIAYFIPSIEDTYIFQLVVSDSYFFCDTEIIHILVDINHEPIIKVTSISGNCGTITINYMTSDTEGDTLITYGWQYSYDAVMWYSINDSSISGNNPQPPGSYQLFWNTLNELEDVYDTNIYFRMKCIESQDIESETYVLFGDTFSSTTVNTSNWTITQNSPTINTSGNNEPAGIYSLELDGSDDIITSKTIDMSGKSNAALSFYFERGGSSDPPESSDYLRLYYYSTTGYKLLTQIFGNSTGESTFTDTSLDLPSDAYHSGFKFYFESKGSGSSYDDFYIDDVYLTMDAGLSSPYCDVDTSADSIIISNSPDTPTGQITSISGTQDTITIFYNISDGQNDTATTELWYYSRNNSIWYPIDDTAIFNNDYKSPGNNKYIQWVTSTYLSGIYDDSVYFKMVLFQSDSSILSDTLYSSSFIINNDKTNPTTPVIRDIYSYTNQDTVKITLSSSSYDAYFSHYEIKGGQYYSWTNTGENNYTGFVFALRNNQNNYLYVKGKDYGGNSSSSDYIIIVHDNIPPDTPGKPVIDDYRLGQMTFIWTESDGNPDTYLVYLSINNGDFNYYTRSDTNKLVLSSINMTSTYRIQVVAIDNAYNYSDTSAGSDSYIVDNLKPTVIISSPADNYMSETDSIVYIKGYTFDNQAVKYIKVTCNGQDTLTLYYNTNMNLFNGDTFSIGVTNFSLSDNKICVYAYDFFNNRGISNEINIIGVHYVKNLSTTDILINQSVIYTSNLGQTKINIPANTFSDSTSIGIIENKNNLNIELANATAENNPYIELPDKLSNTIREFLASSEFNTGKTVTITIPYDNSFLGEKMNFIKMAYLNDTIWQPLTNSSVSFDNCHVSATVSHFSVYRLLLYYVPAQNLDSVKVYPNPFIPSQNHTQIVFSNITENSVIKIFTITGKKVIELKDNTGIGTVYWSGKNSNGDEIASNIYIYIIQSETGLQTAGKISIIK